MRGGVQHLLRESLSYFKARSVQLYGGDLFADVCADVRMDVAGKAIAWGGDAQLLQGGVYRAVALRPLCAVLEAETGYGV